MAPKKTTTKKKDTKETDEEDPHQRLRNAFAVLKNDGSVVSWGKNIPDPQNVNQTLANENFRHVYSNAQAFAGVKQDGSVISWGSSVVSESVIVDSLKANVISIAGSSYALWANPYFDMRIFEETVARVTVSCARKRRGNVRHR